MNIHVIDDLLNFNTISNDILIIPILSDHKLHRCKNSISFIYLYDYVSKREFIINANHHDYPETLNLSKIKSICTGNIYVYNKSYIYKLFESSLDINLMYWIEYNESLQVEYPSEIQVYHRWYNTTPCVNNIIPMMNWLIYCRNIKAQTVTIRETIDITGPYKFYNETLLNQLYKIENSGICVDPNLAQKYIKSDSSMLYCQYNMFTATGRPSNHYDSINYAALNKKTGIRSMIQSRFGEDGILIEWDFESMHVRLIADLIGFDLPAGNLHEYFGRFYFKTPVLDKEMYVKSKNITWQTLYNNMEYKYIEIPFFKEMYSYRKELWAKFKTDGYIEMPLSKKLIKRSNFTEKMSSNILFNYMIQGYETEYNSVMLSEIFKYLLMKNSKLILYTYDSFLFDFNRNDGKQFINDITEILNQNNMNTTIKIGKNYNSMRSI